MKKILDEILLIAEKDALLKNIILICFLTIVIYIFNLFGRLLFKVFLNQFQNEIVLLYKDILLKLAVKGGYFGGVFGPLIFIFYFFLDFIIKHFFYKTTLFSEYNIKKFRGIFKICINFYYENHLIYSILLALLIIIVIIFYINSIIKFVLFFGGLIGVFWGIIFNLILGLIYKTLKKIEKIEFNVYLFKIDIPTYVSAGFIGVISSMILFKFNVLYSLIFGFTFGVVNKYIDKIYSQIIFSFAKKISVNALKSVDKYFISLSLVIVLILSYDKNYQFNFKIFYNILLFYFPYILINSNIKKINSSYLMKSYITYMIKSYKNKLFSNYFISNLIIKSKNRFLLYFFIIIVSLFFQFVITMSIDNIVWISFVIFIIIYKNFPSWTFIILGLYLEFFIIYNNYDINHNLKNIFIDLLIWSFIGQLYYYLNTNENNSINDYEIKKIIIYSKRAEKNYI